MRWLWGWISRRHLVEARGRTLLTVSGVALGVAVFVGIRLANQSAMASFSETVDAVAGRANLEIGSDTGGLDERWYPIVRREPGVESAAPVIESWVRARVPGAKRATRGIPRASVLATAAFSDSLERSFDQPLLLLGLDVFAESRFGRLPADSAGHVRLGGGGALIEFLADRRSCAITNGLASRLGLGIGRRIALLAEGRVETLLVRRVIASEALEHATGGQVVIVDIATAQEVLQRFGRLDRIDLRVDPRRLDAVRAALVRRLPAPLTVEAPQGRTRQVENMVAAFRLNLEALSFVALLVAMFLIFNAVSMSVVRRRAELGTLRALGATRGLLLRQILLEGLVLGLAGGALGLGLGVLFAGGALGAVSRTLTALYLVEAASRIHLDAGTMALGGALGVGTALLAALAPALEAASASPRDAIHQGAWIAPAQMAIPRWTVTGCVALLLGLVVAVWTVAQERPLGGFASAFLILLGFALLAPGFTLVTETLAAPLLARVAGIEAALGARNLREALARTSVMVAALMVAVGMTVALAIMVGSFRRTVETWVNQTVLGDLYVRPAGSRPNAVTTVLDPQVVEVARRLPGVNAVDAFRAVRIRFEGRPAVVGGSDLAVTRDFGHLQFLSGDSRSVLQEALDRNAVIVTESFARHHHVARGRTLVLQTPSGPARLPVAGVFYDYSSDAGGVFMDRSLFRRLWRDDRVQSCAIYLARGVRVEDVERRLTETLGPGTLLAMTPNRSLRQRALAIFDQTFQITWALQGIAILVAVLGVIEALTTLILQRGRDIGVLRAIGALRAQVRRMVLVESALLGLIGALLGCVCGVALSLLLVHVINRQFFGWTIRMTIDPLVFVRTTAMIVGAALVAGIAPARLAASRLAALAMREE